MPRFLSFVFLGILIVFFAIGIILLSYILIVGAVVGMLIFAAVWIKEKLFPGKYIAKPETKMKSPRTFDHEK